MAPVPLSDAANRTHHVMVRRMSARRKVTTAQFERRCPCLAAGAIKRSLSDPCGQLVRRGVKAVVKDLRPVDHWIGERISRVGVVVKDYYC